MEGSIGNHFTKIETIKTPTGDEVSFCPERGGIITSIKFKGNEILYLDQATLHDRKVNVKGGIPILFPNAGPLESGEYPNLKQHGFARDSSNWKNERAPHGFRETLVADKESLAMFPYDFRFSMDAGFNKDGSFTMYQEVENLASPINSGLEEESNKLPLSMGLHPYFKVPQDRKSEIKFNFEGGKFIEEQAEVWANGKAISIDNPKVKDPSAIMEIVIPTVGTLIIDASPIYKKIWVWSMPGKGFVCVEPVMRNKGGLVEDPEIIKPKGTLRAYVNFSLKSDKNT